MSKLNIGQAIDLSEMVEAAKEAPDVEKAAQLPIPKG